MNSKLMEITKQLSIFMFLCLLFLCLLFLLFILYFYCLSSEVKEFCYLACKITKNEHSKEDIKNKLAQGRRDFTQN